MAELAYSLHLGSDKNRKNVSKARAKSNASRTTSLSNNASSDPTGSTNQDRYIYGNFHNLKIFLLSN